MAVAFTRVGNARGKACTDKVVGEVPLTSEGYIGCPLGAGSQVLDPAERSVLDRATPEVMK